MKHRTKRKYKMKKGGTKSEERRRTTIGNAIEGTKYKFRASVHNIMDKLKRTIGHEYVGPPDFKGTHTWTSKYEELKNIMPELGKRDNDSTLMENGSTYYNLIKLKEEHDMRVVEYNDHHIEIQQMLAQLPPIPTSKPTKLTMKKKSRAKSTQ